jgi:hypothetical protein
VPLLAIIVAACAAPEAASESPSTPSGIPSPSATADTTSPASPSVSPSPTEPPPLAFTWSEQVIDGEVQDVIVDGDRLVAVGRADNAQRSWESIGGSPWQPVPVPPPTGLIEDSGGIPADYATRGSSMGSLVRLDETLYSFGFFNLMDFIRPVAWRWSDGEQWAYIDSTNPFFAQGSVSDVVAGEGALVAARSEPALGWSGADTTVWTWR